MFFLMFDSGSIDITILMMKWGYEVWVDIQLQKQLHSASLKNELGLPNLNCRNKLYPLQMQQ